MTLVLKMPAIMRADIAKKEKTPFLSGCSTRLNSDEDKLSEITSSKSILFALRFMCGWF